jgi:hypothetical protein
MRTMTDDQTPDHPYFWRQDWEQAVREGWTEQGYAPWVEQQVRKLGESNAKTRTYGNGYTLIVDGPALTFTFKWTDEEFSCALPQAPVELSDFCLGDEQNEVCLLYLPDGGCYEVNMHDDGQVQVRLIPMTGAFQPNTLLYSHQFAEDYDNEDYDNEDNE